MIVWTFEEPATFYDPNVAFSGIVDKGDYVGASSKKFTMTHNDEKVVFKGDFTFSGDMPTSGKITEVKVFYQDTLILDITGVSVGVKAFMDLSGSFTDESEVIDLFRAGPTKMIGTAGTDYMYGGPGKDKMLGHGGPDSLFGGRGKDKLDAGGASDQMTGGPGHDKFYFTAALGNGDDQITDFSHAADTIMLDHRIFKKLNDSGLVKSKFFHVGAEAADGNDFLIYDKTIGSLFYDRDGKGGHSQVLFATLTNTPQDVAADDFIMI